MEIVGRKTYVRLFAGGAGAVLSVHCGILACGGGSGLRGLWRAAICQYYRQLD